MYNEIEAVVVLCKCGEVHLTYGIRAEKANPDHWHFTWAFPIKENTAKREGYNKTSVGGSIDFSADYPGCPYCGQIGFVFCHCGHISCNVLKDGIFTCEWCGSQGKLEGSYLGTPIKAGNDI